MSSSPLHNGRRSVQSIRRMKGGSEAFVSLTAYTAPMAQLADGVADLVLVGDSLGMVIYGMPDTLSVTLEMMIAHGKCVAANTKKALCVVDMPFGSYQASPSQAFENSARVIKETGAQAVKLEGGAEMAATIEFLTQRGIPVLAHIGLRPQNVHAMGGYRVQGKDDDAATRLFQDARAVEAAGAFAVVVEGVVESVARELTKAISIPTIGIGASAACDGQIIVSEDMLGLTPGPKAKFVKMYANLHADAEKAMTQFAADVRARKFPAAENTYEAKSDVRPISKSAS
jgi:3-methyl-2-oxobutanoate hydroxymethyltransferase